MKGAVLAAIGVLFAGLLSALLASGRSSQRARYVAARLDQRKAAAGARLAPTTPPSTAPALKAPRCVRGVDTFASALARVDPMPDKANRQTRLSWVQSLSDDAVRDERLAERARPAPTLPKRMGTDSSRQPLVPAKAACDGSGFAELP
jgi:hypothetical protein